MCKGSYKIVQFIKYHSEYRKELNHLEPSVKNFYKLNHTQSMEFPNVRDEPPNDADQALNQPNQHPMYGRYKHPRMQPYIQAIGDKKSRCELKNSNEN